MSINNFPTVLQPIIQQNMLEREFEQAIRSKLAYRMIAERRSFPTRIGETLTMTRAGLKATVTTPLVASANTNFDNGLTSSQWAVEQFTLAMNIYGATTDLNTVTDRVGIASQFLQNAYVNGEQAARSLDELARNALFQAYMGGNTRVRVTLGSAGPAVQVDDIRGFIQAPTNGVMAAVSSGNTLSVTVGSDVYTLIGAVADGTAAAATAAGLLAPSLMVFSGSGSNVSTAPQGFSGVLTFSTNVTVADATALNAVTAANTSAILRPSGRLTTAAIQATDLLTMSNLLDAVARLRLNAVPEVAGAYNCYLDPVSARQLFADPDFKQLFQGATASASAFRAGMVNDFLGLRFFPTTEAFVQAHPSISGLNVRRPIIVGADALVEGTFAGMGDMDIAGDNAMMSVVDGVAMVTREPLDRLQQIIAQSWYWIGGYVAPSDTTTTSVTVPTSTSAVYKRAVTIEHAG